MYLWSAVLYLLQVRLVVRTLPRVHHDAPDNGAPPAVRMPSLLRSLLSEHLDPGYAAAADRRRLTGRVRRPAAERLWQALAALLVAVVFAAAAAQARSTAPGVSAARDVLAESVADTRPASSGSPGAGHAGRRNGPGPAPRTGR